MESLHIVNRKGTTFYVLVDNEDLNLIGKSKWHLSSNGYAITQIKRGKFILMHRLINKTPKGFDTDHINRNKLDNRKINLRTANHKINSINRNNQKNNTSGHKGIHWNKHAKKWEVYIWNNQSKIHLGNFKNIKKAILERKKAEKLYWKI